MSPLETLREINQLTARLVELGISNEQNFPTTDGDPGALFEISVSSAREMSIALKNVDYRDIYRALCSSSCFNIKMLDGALMTFRYRFKAGRIQEHCLTYFPSPDLECFRNDPEVYLLDEVYADVVARNIVPVPVRFDFSENEEKHQDVDHPFSHLTLGQYENCRIPVCSPVTPWVFCGFILRSFYNIAYRKYSDTIPHSTARFPKTISVMERKVPHLVCGPD